MSLAVTVSGLYNAAEPVEKVGTSALGTPVKSNIVFKEISYETREGVTEELRDPDVPEGYLRLDDAIFMAENQKEIKRTKVPGSNGTVTEYISDGDYSVRISGKLVNMDSDNRPQELMKKLERVCAAEVPIEITCPFLNILGIDQVVIKSRRIEEERGMANQVSFQIEAYAEETPVADINKIQPRSAITLPSF